MSVVKSTVVKMFGSEKFGSEIHHTPDAHSKKICHPKKVANKKCKVFIYLHETARILVAHILRSPLPPQKNK